MNYILKLSVLIFYDKEIKIHQFTLDTLNEINEVLEGNLDDYLVRVITLAVQDYFGTTSSRIGSWALSILRQENSELRSQFISLAPKSLN